MTSRPLCRGQSLYWVVTVINTMAKIYMNVSLQWSAGAAELAEHKNIKYSFLPVTFVFQPITMGWLNQTDLDFVCELSRHMQETSGDPRGRNFLLHVFPWLTCSVTTRQLLRVIVLIVQTLSRPIALQIQSVKLNAFGKLPFICYRKNNDNEAGNGNEERFEREENGGRGPKWLLQFWNFVGKPCFKSTHKQEKIANLHLCDRNRTVWWCHKVLLWEIPSI